MEILLVDKMVVLGSSDFDNMLLYSITHFDARVKEEACLKLCSHLWNQELNVTSVSAAP
jgi:hypothetical protein